MLKRLLIANRGEIAVRIIRTARRLGIETVAVYSDADVSAVHVAAADKAVRIGTSSPRESYLNVDAIIKAAHQTEATAVHPGYGFLSENADFAEACAGAGLTFVGPPPAAIRAMGLKDRAKVLMQEAGLSVVPGYMGGSQEPSFVAKEAKKLGYPILIKPIAGGGGKGMRRVDASKDFAVALESAKREAASAFGDDRVLVEKYISRPRHIEVQIFADAHGSVVHLFERDCSLQRRHQKVIEEAPAPGMSARMRQFIGDAAVRAARAVGYVGAGTLEFIADASDGLQKDRIWFMEMNTRLQVEHAVTEEITGHDLVEWQLRIAAGEKLPVTQGELKTTGHAIEARLYAEDPANGFLPSTGTLERLVFSSDVRVDSGVKEGDTVSAFYDPMIAKIIAHDVTRQGAAAKLRRALAKTQIAGVRTNNAFLMRALEDPDFLQGEIDTGFLEQKRDVLAAPQGGIPAAVLSAAVHLIVDEHLRPSITDGADPWNSRDNFRLIGPAHWSVDFTIDGKRVSVQEPNLPKGETDIFALRLASGEIAVITNGETFNLREYDPLAVAEAAGQADDRIVVPMSGKITKLFAKAGDHVVKGQPLAVLEAMKMEHTLIAPADGTIESMEMTAGGQVQEGTVVVRFCATDPRL